MLFIQFVITPLSSLLFQHHVMSVFGHIQSHRERDYSFIILLSHKNSIVLLYLKNGDRCSQNKLLMHCLSINNKHTCVCTGIELSLCHETTNAVVGSTTFCQPIFLCKSTGKAVHVILCKANIKI